MTEARALTGDICITNSIMSTVLTVQSGRPLSFKVDEYARTCGYELIPFKMDDGDFNVRKRKR